MGRGYAAEEGGVDLPPIKENFHRNDLPEGFRYQSDFISPHQERSLLSEFEGLEFQLFDFHGYIAKRRIVEYGFEYDFRARKAAASLPIPDFLKRLRDNAAGWSAIEPDEIVQAVITEYTPGSPIGWHRDVPQFETIVGISLNSSCRLRFKPYGSEGNIAAVTLEPRSVYVMRGIARWNFQHSIPAVKALRYSITFRTLRKRAFQKSKSDGRMRLHRKTISIG